MMLGGKVSDIPELKVVFCEIIHYPAFAIHRPVHCTESKY